MAPTTALVGKPAYVRMRAEHRAELVPKCVLLSNDERDCDIDRGNSFWVKAALVYEAVTKHHIDDSNKPLARDLLLWIAKECYVCIHSADPPAKVDDEEGSDKNKQLIDAIFLVVGFLSRLHKAMNKERGNKAGAAATRDALDDTFKARHMQGIVVDVIKLENQIPLNHLFDVASHVERVVRTAPSSPDLKDKLAALAAGDDVAAKLQKYELGFDHASFGDVIAEFCWYYSPFFSKQVPSPSRAPAPAPATSKEEGTLLDRLHASVARLDPAEKGSDGGGKTSRIRTARELRRASVRFAAVEEGRATVVVFEGGAASATLRLPALAHDFKVATVARNLLAREHGEQTKPVTRYFQLMNELVQDAADVSVLRRAGVVRAAAAGYKDEEMLDLIKRIDGHATYPSVFMAMDMQIEKVEGFYVKRMSNFFVRYRPAVIAASSVVAASVVAIVATRKRRG